jgi:hypothetical protein
MLNYFTFMSFMVPIPFIPVHHFLNLRASAGHNSCSAENF